MGSPDMKPNVQRGGVSKNRVQKPKKRKFKKVNDKQKSFSATSVNDSSNDVRTQKIDGGKQKRLKLVERLKQKKTSKQEELARQRAQFDDRLRSEPHVVLWEHYCDWAGERLTNSERSDEKWTSEQVLCLEDDDPGGANMMDKVKSVIGPDFKTSTGFESVNRKRRNPSVACIMVALSTDSVLSFAKRMHDGQQVGKFFSKHTDPKLQGLFVRKQCKKSILPTAAGNVSRLDRLFTDGLIDLQYTQALLVDFGRDSKLFNITEHNYRDGFFNLIHHHVRNRIPSGMKLVVVIPSVDKSSIERREGAKQDDEQAQLKDGNNESSMEKNGEGSENDD